MAEIIGAIVLASLPEVGVGAATSFSLTAGGLSIGASAIGGAVLTVGAVALQVAIGGAKQPKAPDSLITIRQPNPVRQGGYGRARVSGSYMLYDTVASGASWFSIDVVAILSGRLCGVRGLYLHDDAITLVDPGEPIFSHGVNPLPNGTYGSSIQINARPGLPIETPHDALGYLLPASWTAAHRGDGIASLYLSCAQTSAIADMPKTYPNGKPEPSVVADLYPVWDPRDAAQDPNDPDTWVAYPVWSASTVYGAGARVILPSLMVNGAAYNAGTSYARWAVVSSARVDWYSRVDGNVGNTPGNDLTKWIPIGTPYYSYFGGNLNFAPDAHPDKWCSVIGNPVLQFIDHRCDADHGEGLDRDILILPKLAALMVEANLCDALVADKTGAQGPRYVSGGKYNFDDDPIDRLNEIGATADMWWAEDGDGGLVLTVGVYREPTLTLRYDRGEILVGPFSAHCGVADQDAVNELTLTFTSPAHDYKEVPGAPWRDQDDIDQRGALRTQPFSLTWVQRHSQARRLAKRAMARKQRPTGSMPLPLTAALRALGHRWVRIQYPFLDDLADAVVELSNIVITPKAASAPADWLLIDPATIDAWNPTTEEGEAPLP